MGARQAGIPGGLRLRALREQCAKTQLWVELEAGLGTGYLQRVESGKVALPERATLERILTALGARYSEQREILELFGYTIPTPLPTTDDIVWARAVCQHELHEVTFPAYVLDCTHRLVVWNQYFPRLLGCAPDDPHLEQFGRQSFLALWFDPTSVLAPLIAEPEVILPALMRALRYEMQQFSTETWYAQILEQLLRLPCFQYYWTREEHEPASASAARALVPLRLTIPHAGHLQFRLSSERFTRDARFRMIYYFPADPATMQWCSAGTG